MKDIQSEEPIYKIEINKVGISGIMYPIRVLKKDTSYLNTVATISTFVKLPANKRGTHMSRFIELLEKYKYDINTLSIEKMTQKLLKYLETDYSEVSIEFPYFIQKKTPVSKMSCLSNFFAGFLYENRNSEVTHKIKIRAVVTSLCPCSKEISKYGAHNQRAYITLILQPKEDVFIWLEDMLELVEESGSSIIYPLLKRVDEKEVTEHAYENPMFMEDIVRKLHNITINKYNDDINYIFIKAESEESIHQHLASAEIEQELS